jgi:hypothetical protein
MDARHAERMRGSRQTSARIRTAVAALVGERAAREQRASDREHPHHAERYCRGATLSIARTCAQVVRTCSGCDREATADTAWRERWCSRGGKGAGSIHVTQTRCLGYHRRAQPPEVRMGSFFRVFGFMGQVLGMIRQNPRLLTPLVLNLAIATPVNIVLAIAAYFVPDNQIIWNAFMLVALTSLYFIDYFCAGLNTSMVFEQVTTNQAALGSAFSRTLRSTLGILIFAMVSALFDLLAQVAAQQRGFVRQILIGILRSLWTTATYVVMPAMVVEGLSFFDAFKRSKQLMENDPTQVGVGIVGMGLVSWLISAATGVLAFGAFNALAPINVALGMGVALFFTNAFWALSAYLKSTYYTCFYLWSRECERNNAANPQWAPAPLRAVLPANLSMA